MKQHYVKSQKQMYIITYTCFTLKVIDIEIIFNKIMYGRNLRKFLTNINLKHIKETEK